MEIFTTNRKTYSAGLLIFAVALLWGARPLALAAAEPVPWSYIWSLRLTPKDSGGTLYADTDISFSTELKSVASDTVSLSLNSLPQNVNLVSSKRESTLIKNEDGTFSSGTRITLVLNFAKAGRYRLQPLDLVIDRNFYQLPFDSIDIKDNPRTARSELALSFGGTDFISSGRRSEIPQGKAVVFTVTAKNISEVRDIFWDIPENCIFKKTNGYEFPAGDANVPNTFYPVASFVWTPLTAGETPLPKITVRARSYSGSIVNMETPDFTFFAVTESDANEPQPEPAAPNEASEEAPAEHTSSGGVPASRADAEQIAELRRAERHALPFSVKAYTARVSKEVSLGLSSPKKEPNVVLLSLLFGGSALLLISSVAALFLRKKKAAIPLAAGALLFLIPALVYTPGVARCHAVYSGGSVSLIPEASASQSATFPVGCVVLVKEKAGAWAYIEYNKVSGWTPSASLFIIE